MTTWRSCWGFIWWHWTYNRSYSIICLWFSLVHRGHFHLACWKNKSVPKIIFYNSCIAETQAWAVLKTSHHLRFCQSCSLITVYSDKIYTSLTMSNDERKHYFLLFGIALKQRVDILGWENNKQNTTSCFLGVWLQHEQLLLIMHTSLNERSLV